MWRGAQPDQGFEALWGVTMGYAWRVTSLLYSLGVPSFFATMAVAGKQLTRGEKHEKPRR